MENLNFKHFVENEFMSDVEKTVAKIPKSHKDLIKDYKFKSESGNTLGGKGKHVGEIDEKKKHIKVAAPYNYSREFTILHEISHAVWKYKMTDQLKKEWNTLVKNTKKEQKDKDDKTKDAKDSLDQNAEEIFCMVYSNVYSKHPTTTYDHDAWKNFILSRVPA
jgi:hypothetical protein